MSDIAETWKQFKEEQPELALALSVLPVSGQAAAAVEYYDAVEKGDVGGGVMAAIQFIPVVGKGLRSLAGAARASNEAHKLADMGRYWQEAKIGRGGESVAELAEAAFSRAKVGAGETVSGAVSGVTNFGEYLGQRISQANAALQEGFNQVRAPANK